MIYVFTGHSGALAHQRSITLYKVTFTSNIDKLQPVQNTLARVVSRGSRFDRATPLLADLQWLPVRYRIEYKLAQITFKALTRQEPQYLAELIRMYEAPKQLRPRGTNILQCSLATLNFSRNAFCHAAPAVCNKLPETVTSDITVSIATFKSRLKAALYNRAFLR